MERIDGVLDGVDYHVFYLATDDDLWGVPEGSFRDEIDPHTPVVPMDHSVCVFTGIAMGQVHLTIEVLGRVEVVEAGGVVAGFDAHAVTSSQVVEKLRSEGRRE